MEYRRLVDKKYNTCITSSVHSFISDVFQYNKNWKECFSKLSTDAGIKEFTKLMTNEYISSHKSYRVIRSEPCSKYEPMIFELVYAKLKKIRVGG